MEWIKCSDRLPDDGSKVLIFVYDEIAVAEYLPNYLPEVGDVWRLAEYSACSWPPDAVSHWMPLPPPPSQPGIALIAGNVSMVPTNPEEEYVPYAEWVKDAKTGEIISFDLKWPEAEPSPKDRVAKKYQARYDEGFSAGAANRQGEIDEIRKLLSGLNEEWLFWYHMATPEQLEKYEEKYGPIIWMAGGLQTKETEEPKC